MEQKFKKTSTYNTWGIISLVAGIPLLFFNGAGSPLVLIGIVQLTQPAFPLQFYSNYLTFKQSSLSPLKIVKFNEINNITYSDKKIIVSYHNKKIRLAKGIFMKNDWNEIINIFMQIRP